MSDMRVEEFRSEQHLGALVDVVGQARCRGDIAMSLHPGGLQWWLRRVGRPGFDVAVLRADGEVAGLALRDEEEVLVEAVDAHSAWRRLLLEWVEPRIRGRGGDAFIPVADDDNELRELVLSRGHEPTEQLWYELVCDLARDTYAPALPAGFAMMSLTPPLTDRYVALHRAAWSRPDRPSSYDRESHDAVTRMPDFRYDMVPIAVAADGSLAASCISWWDERSRSVEIEPLGTHPDFRRMGLARAIVDEVLRRSRALGAEYVMVWGTSSLPDARALYESAGFRARRVLRDYRWS